MCCPCPRPSTAFGSDDQHAAVGQPHRGVVAEPAKLGARQVLARSAHAGEVIRRIIINVGGGPTDDKPTVTLEAPRDPDRVSSFLNIRVKDIAAVYAEWSARGAQFLTPPKQHQYEIRCYIRDPDGHLIEVGQTTDPQGDWSPAHWPSSTAAEKSE
jgi:catechol 2,3-dioxygenase-like lactoylglutathione lyase family enzyme